MKSAFRPRWTLALAIALASGAVGLGLWSWSGRARALDMPRPDEGSLAHGPSSQPASAGAVACRLEPGDVLAFDYRSQTSYVVDPAGLGAPGAPPRSDVNRFEGTLTLRVLPARAEAGAVLLGRFSGLNAEAREVIGSGVDAAFLVRVDERCALTGFARSPSTPVLGARSLQVAMYDLWFSAPREARSEPLAFRNGVGAAQAVFAREGPSAVVRRVTAYEQVWGLPGARPAIRASELVANLDGTWFSFLRSTEELEGVGHGLQSTKLELTVERRTPDLSVFSGASERVGDYLWEDLLSGAQALARPSEARPAPQERRMMEAMRDVSFEAAATGFTARVMSRANIEDQWRPMAAYLTQHPDDIVPFAKSVLSPTYPEAMKGASYLVLSKVADARARDVLLTIRGNAGVAPMDRVRAGVALATRRDVGVELARAFAADASAASGDKEQAFYGRQALLHLGMLAGAHPADAEVRQVAQGTLQQALAAGHTPGELSPVFSAIGNMAEPSMLSDVDAWSRHPDASIRALVPSALRRYTQAQVGAMEVSWLARETSHDVKRELLNVIRHQLADEGAVASPALARQALAHLEEQPRLLARQSLVHLLGPLASSDPDVRAALVRQAAVELRNESGLYSQIVQALPAEAVNEALASMPEFQAQYGRAGPSAAPGGAP